METTDRGESIVSSQPLEKVVFLCTENSNRSQMAEAFGRRLGEGLIEVWSAGSAASGMVNPKAVAAMAELGYDLGSHRSQSTQELPEGPFDYVITMGCGDQCPWVAGHHREDWGLADPREMPPAEFNQVRDEIERRVRDLVERVRG